MSLKQIVFDVQLLSTAGNSQSKVEKVMTNDFNSVELIFNILDHEKIDLAAATVDVLLYMRDGSFFQKSASLINGTVSYVLKENEGNHKGVARTQLVVKIDDKDYASGLYHFEIVRGLDHIKPEKEIIVENWDRLVREAQEYVAQFVADEAERQALFETNELNRRFTFEENEFVRQENEAVRVRSEGFRLSAEDSRNDAEVIRNQNELFRIDAEINRQGTFESNESERQDIFHNNEQERVSAENQRVLAEEERQEGYADFDGRISNAEQQFQDVLDETTDQDFNSAPEIKAARGGHDNLSQRLLSTDQQLAHHDNRMNGIHFNAMYPPAPLVAAKADANHYDEVTKKYFKDAAKTIPATDNQPVLQALVNRIRNLGGGTLFLPAGKFVVRSKITWESGVSLIGAGKTSSILYAEGALFSVIEGLKGAGTGVDYAKPEVWLNDCTFADFGVDNKGLTHTEASVAGKALFIIYMKRALFRDLLLMNTIGTALGCDFLVDSVITRVTVINAGRNFSPLNQGGQSGIGIGTSALSEEPIVVSDCFIYNCGNYGIFVETQENPQGVKAKFAKIVNCHAMGNRSGFGNKGSGGTQFIGCTAFKNKLHGFHLTQGANNDMLLGCVSLENQGAGLKVEQVYSGFLDIVSSKFNKNSESGIDVLANTAMLKNMKITHVEAKENGSCGIWIKGNTENLKISLSDVANNGQNAALANAYRRGIFVDGVNTNTALIGNDVYDNQAVKTQQVGIRLSDVTTKYRLATNNSSDHPGGLNYQLMSDDGIANDDNVGLLRKVTGTATLAAGEKAIYVNHFLGKIARAVLITPLGAERVWLKENTEPNRIRVEREGTTGTLSFMYEIRL